MYNNKCIAFFYSKNQNIILAKKVKDVLNKFSVMTVNLYDIDDILLKKYTSIKCLVLDFTSEILDERSLELIKKLKEQKYIKKDIVIKGESFANSSFANEVLYDDDFEVNFYKMFRVHSEDRFENKICETFWMKIVSDYLLENGFSMKHSGFSLLVDSIIYYISKNCVIKNLSKDLYVYLANKYRINISNVEMNIRKAISIASNKGETFPFDYCPTNKEFITYTIIQLYDKIFDKQVISI